MNRFQWDLRYPDATDVNGFYPPEAAGGLADSVSGPTVVPGTYHVTLAYGTTKIQRDFTITLDPRIHATPADLAASLELQLRISHALDSLDKTVNQALAAREGLQTKVSNQQLSQHRAAPALDTLNKDIAAAVQLEIRSSEGDSMQEPSLHSHLAYLQADIGLAYGAPTAAQSAAFQELDREANNSRQKLSAATAAANKLM